MIVFEKIVFEMKLDRWQIENLRVMKGVQENVYEKMKRNEVDSND